MNHVKSYSNQLAIKVSKKLAQWRTARAQELIFIPAVDTNANMLVCMDLCLLVHLLIGRDQEKYHRYFNSEFDAELVSLLAHKLVNKITSSLHETLVWDSHLRDDVTNHIYISKILWL